MDTNGSEEQSIPVQREPRQEITFECTVFGKQFHKNENMLSHMKSHKEDG